MFASSNGSIAIILSALYTITLCVTIDAYPTGGVMAGQTYSIMYSPKDQLVTFVLRRGPSTQLDTVGSIGTGSGGNFTWKVPLDLPNAPNYALEIQQADGPPNYSGVFGLTGGSTISWTTSIPQTSSHSSTQSQSLPATASAGSSSPPADPQGTTGKNGLTTGAKAGIGIAVSIAGLLLILGASFIGIHLQRKSKQRKGTETASYGWKPELDGKTKFFSTSELDGLSSMLKEADATPAVASTTELPTRPAPIANTGRTEMSADLGGAEIYLNIAQQQYHELPGEYVSDGSPVSPASSHTRPTPVSRRDTYDDPRLVLNPWANDDVEPRS